MTTEKYRQLHGKMRKILEKNSKNCDGFVEQIGKEYPELKDFHNHQIFETIKGSLEFEKYYLTESKYGGYSGVGINIQFSFYFSDKKSQKKNKVL